MQRQHPTSLVLLSSGLDSCFALVEAMKSTRVVYALTFDYGQAAKDHEISLAKKITKHFNLPHKVIKLPYFKYVNKKVWVPNRNGVFLNVAAAIAETENIQKITVGFNREEAADFPDNSITYINNINRCFKYSTRNSVQVIAPAARLNKTQILKKLMTCRGAPMCAPSQKGWTHRSAPTFPLKFIWSCYRSGQTMCGRCISCRRLKRAIKALNVEVKLFNF